MKTKHTVRAGSYRVYAFRSVACVQHGIKKVLWVTQLLNGLWGGGGGEADSKKGKVATSVP